MLADLLADRDVGTSKPIALQMTFGVLAWKFHFLADMDDKLVDVLFSLLRQLILTADICCSLKDVLDLSCFMLAAGSQIEITKQTLPLLLPKHLVAKHTADSLIQKLSETQSAMAGSLSDPKEAKLAFLRNATEKNIWTWTFFPLVCYYFYV